jgi:hypothetical protein
MKELVIDHLKGISNQEAGVPLPGLDYILVKDLVNEVEKETLTGIKYMVEWAKATAFLKEIKSKNKFN